MALSESEEFELLSLERERAMGGQQQPATTQNKMGGTPPLSFVAKQVANLDPRAHLVENLPALGATVGMAAGGLGAPIGAGLGQIGKNMAQIAMGDPNAPTTAAGAALPAMGQSALAGISQAPQVLKEIPGVPAIVDAVKRAGSTVGNGMARLLEAASGEKARDIKRLFNNPAEPFTLGSRQAAGNAIGNAKTIAGVNPGVTEDISSFTPENVFKETNVNSIGANALQQVAEANASGVKPSAEDVGDALKYVGDQIRTGIRQGTNTNGLQNMQDHLNTILEDVAPGVQAARQEYGPIAQRDKFLKIFPTNKDGSISKANLFYLNSLLANTGGALGLAAGGAHGAGLGATLGILGGIAARSPLTTGLATAGAGAMAKGLNVLGSNPETRQALAQVLQRIIASRQAKAKS